MPMAILAPVIALAVGLLPMAVEELLKRRSAAPIRVTATRDTSPGVTIDTSADSANAHACRPADDSSNRFISDVLHIAASIDPEWAKARAQLEIPQVDSGAVALVSDDAICRQVLSAFYTTLPSDWPKPLPTAVYVAQVGPVYIGMAPVPPKGEIRAHIVTSRRFKVLGQYWR